MSASIASNDKPSGQATSQGIGQGGNDQAFQDALNTPGQNRSAPTGGTSSSSSTPTSPAPATLNSNNFETQNYSVYLAGSAVSIDLVSDTSGKPLANANVTIYNNQTHESQEIYGPLLNATEGTSESEAQHDLLQINLANNTQLVIKPVAQSVPTDAGSTNIGSVAITKDGQTAFYNGLSTGNITHTQFQSGTAAELDPQDYGGNDTIVLDATSNLSSLSLKPPSGGSASNPIPSA